MRRLNFSYKAMKEQKNIASVLQLNQSIDIYRICTHMDMWAGLKAPCKYLMHCLTKIIAFIGVDGSKQSHWLFGQWNQNKSALASHAADSTAMASYRMSVINDLHN